MIPIMTNIFLFFDIGYYAIEKNNGMDSSTYLDPEHNM